jgi:sugar phosphate permease
MDRSIESSRTERPTKIRYLVLSGFCAVAAIAYIQRYSINLFAPSIQDDLSLDKDQMGSVMSGFFAGYALTQIPAAWLGDRWGTRRALALYSVVWSLATGLMAAADNLDGLIIVWTLMGMAQAGIFPCAIIGLREWQPATQRGIASGMLATFMNVGAVLAPLVAGWLLTRYNWRDAFVWLSAPGIVWAAWYFWWYRNRPAEHKSVNAAEKRVIASGAEHSTAAAPVKPRTPWLKLLTSFRMWLICAQHFLRAAAQVFFGTWFGTFLMESPGIAESDVPLLAAIPPMLLIVGSTAGGVISDSLLRSTGSRRVARQGLAVVNLAVCAGMFVAAALFENAYVRVGLISAGCLFMTIGGVSAYAITMDVGGRHVAAVFSTMNMCGSIGAAAFPKYAGWLVERTGDWNDVLLSIAVIYVAAAVCWALLNPDGTLFEDRSGSNAQTSPR